MHPQRRNSKRAPLWLPYLQSAQLKRGAKFEFVYNGGEVTTDLSDVSSILLYGDTPTPLTTKMIDAIARKGVPIIIHRRNMSQSIYISGGWRPDPDDTLSAQLIKRKQSRVCTHVTRQLLQAKFRSMSWLVEPAQLQPHLTVAELRNIEAQHAKKYWRSYMKKLEPITGHPEWTRRAPRPLPGETIDPAVHKKNPVGEALDAVSKFVSGVLLRWITYHHLSPHHGFLHQPTDYPSLVYDLMEPYRGLVERNLLVHWMSEKTATDELINSGISATKIWFDEQSYVPLTRQIVTNQELLHGVVLSLKFYLLGRQRKFHVPFPGPPKGGRPPKVDFLLYGRHAGRTDFWKQAKALPVPDHIQDQI